MMKNFPPEVRQLRQLLQEKVLLWSESKSPVVLFDAPPVALGEIDICEINTPSLPKVSSERRSPHVRRWDMQRLNAINAPMLGCVFEGEADYKVHRPPGKKGGQWIITLKAGSLFTVVSGIPFSDGSKVAWERSQPQKAYSRVMLMQLRPEGVLCHTFTSDKGKLWLHPYIFLYNFEILSLGEKLQNEMHHAQPSTVMVSLYWQLIINSLIRTIDEGDVSVLNTLSVTPSNKNTEDFLSHVKLEGNTAIQLAEGYIQSHLHDPTLKVLSIAQYVGISQRHLGRLFQQQFAISPYGYVQQKRLEMACALLRNSKLTIRQVARYCGYPQLSHFTTWFTNQTHQSPSQFQKRNFYGQDIKSKS